MNRITPGMLIGFLAFLGTASAQNPPASSDPIAAKLDAAKVTYAQEFEKAKQVVLKAFNEAVEQAREAGDAETVKAIAAERTEFLLTGKTPARFPPNDLIKKRTQIRKDLYAAYTQAIREYLSAQNDVLAERIKDERDRFEKDKPGDLTMVSPFDSSSSVVDREFERVRGVKVKRGDPQFTLVWDSKADLDLHVVEPGGKEIFWNDQKGRQGGELDVDNVEGFGPENIYWMKLNDDGSKSVGPGPAGEYKWWILYYGTTSGVAVPTRWKVRVKHDGQTEVYEGILTVPGAKSRTYSLQSGPR